MGGLLSFVNGTEQRRREAELEVRRLQQRANFLQIFADFDRQRQAQSLRDQQSRQPQELQRRKQMEEQLKMGTIRIGPVRVIPAGTVNSNGYELVPLTQYSSEYVRISMKFRETGKATMKIISFQKINNPFVKTLYDLKKLEVIRNYHTATEQELYHGTLSSNVLDICKNNFNRRRCVRHMYGYAVNFTPLSYFATHYCDKGNCEKIILVCKVIVTRSALGNRGMRVPPAGFDSAQSKNGHVIVKFDDYTYYPQYLITCKFENDASELDNSMESENESNNSDDSDSDIS